MHNISDMSYYAIFNLIVHIIIKSVSIDISISLNLYTVEKGLNLLGKENIFVQYLEHMWSAKIKVL